MEMKKLVEMLNKAGIPCRINIHWSGTAEIDYSSGSTENPESVCDIMRFYGSYCACDNDGQLWGIMNLSCTTHPNDSAEDHDHCMTAEEMFNRINDYYNKK